MRYEVDCDALDIAFVEADGETEAARRALRTVPGLKDQHDFVLSLGHRWWVCLNNEQDWLVARVTAVVGAEEEEE